MFTNPLMLAGIGGAALPLVLHLLSRSRYRSLDWGAMMFLAAADARQQRRSRLKQLLLLLLRMSIIALLAMALARPIVYGRWGALAAEARTTAAIVFDRSMSMGLDEGGKPRIDLARDAAMQVLSHLKGGDQVALILIGGQDNLIDPRPTGDLQSVARALADLKPAAGRASIADALALASAAFKHNPRDNHELFVITDRQAAGWAGVSDDFASAFVAQYQGDEIPPPRFVIIPVGSHAAENVSVEAINLLSPPAVKDQPTDIEITVRNHGRTPQSALPLTLKQARSAKPLLDTTVNLPPQSAQSVRASVRFEHVGPQILTASIQSSGLAMDNDLDAVVEVLKPLDVLIVSGDERKGRWAGESDFIRLALAPFEALKRNGPDLAKVKVIDPTQFAESQPDQYDTIILANVPQLSPADVRLLEQYIYDGGGVLIAPGNLTRIDSYNQLLFRDGAGALPAVLSPATAIDGAGATGLLGLDLSHPVLQFLRALPDPVPSATIGRYFPADASPGRARVLGSYVSGAPFLIEARSGRGRVLLVTTSLDADWNTLPLTGFYLPFVQSAVRYLAGARLGDRNMPPGADLVVTLAQPVEIAKTTMQTPDGQRLPVQGARLGRRTELRFSPADLPGTYLLRAKVEGKDQIIPFVVQSDPGESDLTPIDDQRLLVLAEQMNFELADLTQRPLSNLLSQSTAAKELWPTLLIAVIALACLELYVTRWMSVESA